MGNAFLASKPGHPFWEAVFEGLENYRKIPNVLDATGPFLLTRVYREYPCPSHVTIVPSERLYPITKWEALNGALEKDQARANLPKEAYAVHHWAGIYRREAVIDLVRRRLGRTS